MYWRILEDFYQVKARSFQAGYGSRFTMANWLGIFYLLLCSWTFGLSNRLFLDCPLVLPWLSLVQKLFNIGFKECRVSFRSHKMNITWEMNTSVIASTVFYFSLLQINDVKIRVRQGQRHSNSHFLSVIQVCMFLRNFAKY